MRAISRRALEFVGGAHRAAPAGAEQQGGGEQGDPAADAQPHARAGGLADPADGDAADGVDPLETSVRSDMTRPRIPGLDRSSTLVYNWLCSADPDRELSDEFWERHERSAGRGPEDFIEGTYRLRRNLSNDYLIDRELQRTSTYTGIVGLNTQDYAVQEGMGPILDRSKEHLGSSDKAIIAARRLLREAVDDVAEGRQPAGTDPEPIRFVRPAEAIVEGTAPWHDAMKDLLTAQW